VVAPRSSVIGTAAQINRTRSLMFPGNSGRPLDSSRAYSEKSSVRLSPTPSSWVIDIGERGDAAQDTAKPGLARHSVDELQIVVDGVLQLLPQHVLRGHQHTRPRHSLTEHFGARRGGYRLGQNVGKAGQEVGIVLVVGWRDAVYLENPEGRSFPARDDDIDGRDDLVLAVERRQNKAVVALHVVVDQRLVGDKGATLRRAFVCPRRLVEDCQRISLAEGEAAERGERRLAK
jgi:hypothetical protein